MAARDLALIADAFERAVVRAAEVALEGRARGPGRTRKAITEQCRLFLVGWGAHSAVARFELGRSGGHFSEVAERALAAVFDGLDVLRAVGGAPDKAPPASAAALRELAGLRSLFEHEIETLELTAVNRAERRAIFDRRVAEVVAALVRRPTEAGLLLVTGRLDRLDGHQGLAGALWEDNGTAWKCNFLPELESELAGLWRRRVEVEGIAAPARRPGTPGKIEVVTIRAVEAPFEEASRRFWGARTLDQLALEQGVGPLGTIDELLSVWEEERLERDPFEELMAERERRRVDASAARG